MYDVKEEARNKGGNAIVGTGEFGFGGDTYVGLGGEADEGGGKETNGTETVNDGYLSGEDTVVTITLGSEQNATLAYTLGLELHHPIMINIGEHRCQKYRDIYISSKRTCVMSSLLSCSLMLRRERYL